jgi:NAD(P)-dependent dehydrogenase (short-subunit alcohol dehydrogenase family)
VSRGDPSAGSGSGRGAVVVTGASSGIGRATALHLDSLGFRVFAGVRKASDADALGADGSDRLEPLDLDVADGSSVDSAAREVSERVGDAGLAGLVNNAGIGIGGPVELLELDALRRQLEVNLVGQVAVTQALIPQLRRARGRIVFMSSVGGRLAIPYMSPYHVSKWGLEALADALRIELNPWGIEVVVIEPGSIATPMWDKSQNEADDILERMDAEQRELYGERVAALQAAALEEAARGIPPERVAEVVAAALTARRPRTRYLVGRDAKINARVRRLVPDRVFDRLLSRQLGLR